MGERWLHEQYAGSADPWGYDQRWYEQRKYALTLAALPRPRYRYAFEPGCSIGVLTERLAERCDRLLACDLVPAAVERATERLAGRAGVRVRQWDARTPWPDTGFDLIVVSEVLYYLELEQARTFCRRLTERLAGDGQVVAVHWRRPAGPHVFDGDTADAILRDATGLAELARWCDADFVASVLGRDDRSVAALEGLVEGEPEGSR
ncbi:MAG: SAM-dependent methyltransferase [Propionibacteriaceae bacterium]|nr:SAM-dependent methyltransferase [Propionibacteriaceae bacterium]